LREYAKKNTDLTSLIIGAVGNVSPLLTPRSATELALTRYFSGSSYEQEKQVLEELVSTDRDDILALADTLDKICEGSALCLVGSRENVSACSDFIEKILEL
jgi:Zn-dependent M16 (insulinase) family peptidase